MSEPANIQESTLPGDSASASSNDNDGVEQTAISLIDQLKQQFNLDLTNSDHVMYLVLALSGLIIGLILLITLCVYIMNMTSGRGRNTMYRQYSVHKDMLDSTRNGQADKWIRPEDTTTSTSYSTSTSNALTTGKIKVNASRSLKFSSTEAALPDEHGTNFIKSKAILAKSAVQSKRAVSYNSCLDHGELNPAKMNNLDLFQVEVKPKTKPELSTKRSSKKTFKSAQFTPSRNTSQYQSKVNLSVEDIRRVILHGSKTNKKLTTPIQTPAQGKQIKSSGKQKIAPLFSNF